MIVDSARSAVRPHAWAPSAMWAWGDVGVSTILPQSVSATGLRVREPGWTQETDRSRRRRRRLGRPGPLRISRTGWQRAKEARPPPKAKFRHAKLGASRAALACFRGRRFANRSRGVGVCIAVSLTAAGPRHRVDARLLVGAVGAASTTTLTECSRRSSTRRMVWSGCKTPSISTPASRLVLPTRWTVMW